MESCQAKILIVTSEFPPYIIGGGGIFVKELSRALSHRGCEVTVVSGRQPALAESSPQPPDDSNVDLTWLPLISIHPFRFLFKSNDQKTSASIATPPTPRAILKLWRVLNRDWTHIHLCNYGLIVDLSALLLSVIGKDYIVTIQGLPRTPQESGGVLGFLYGIYTRTLGSLLYSNASRIVTVSKSEGDEFVQAWGNQDKVSTIFNGLDVPAYQEPLLEETKRKIELPKNKEILLCIGYITERKGIQFVIQALPLIQDRFPNVVLAIVGSDGGYLTELKGLIRNLDLEDSVIFTGYGDLTLKKLALQQASVFLVPSIEEPFGIVALEGMAMGKPVVASETGGLKEFLEHGKNALLTSPADPEDIAQSITRLLSDARLAKRISRGALDTVKNFDWSAIAYQYLQIYDEASENDCGAKEFVPTGNRK